MRRFAAAALAAAAVSVTFVASAGAADAATAHQATNPGGDGVKAGLSARSTTGARPVRTGKLHHFRLAPVRGASAWGDWYTAKLNGHSTVILDFYIKDTKADGLSAGICYDLKSPKVDLKNRCLVSQYGYGKTDHIQWTMSFWNQDSMRVRTGVGRLDKQAHIFYTRSLGSWLRLR